MIGSAIAQAKKYVNIILEPSVVNAESIQNGFYEAGEYLVNLDYSQTRGAENIDVIRLKQDYTAVGIKSSGAPRLNRDIIDAKKYVTIHLDGEEFERNNIDYMFQCGEYLVGEVDLSKIKRVRSMNKTFDGDVNVTDVILNTRTVTDAKYAFRDTKIELLNMEEFNFTSPSNFEGLITGVTTLKDITLNSMSGVIWDDVSKSIKNDVRVFKANDCNFIKTLNASTWTACEEFELGSDQLTSLTLFTNRNALKSFVLKAPKANIGTNFGISSDNLEKFELEVKDLSTISVTSPKLKSIDLSKCNTITNFTFNTPLLQELDLSNTLITSLNIKDFANLKASGPMIDSKGWFAKNCKSLKTVLMRMDQVRIGPSDTPLQLDGCTALESVTVYSEDEGETGGVEYHYGTEHHYGKMFLNDKEITGGGADVLDTLSSTSKTEALSANMGKTLNDKKLNIDGSNATEAGTSKQISTLGSGDSVITDSTDLITSHVNGYSTTNKSFYKRKASYLWEYIKSKISSVLGLTATSYNGTAKFANILNAWAKNRQSAGNIAPKDSSEYATLKMHLATSAMTDSGRPDQDGFLVTFFWDSSARWDSQLFIPDSSSSNLKARFYNNEKWTDWVDIAWKSDIPDVSTKMNKTNPTGTGSFSMNRKSGTTVGINSVAEGSDCTASGQYSHAEGFNTSANGDYSHTEGSWSVADGKCSHAEGYCTKASGAQHVQGKWNVVDTEKKFADIIGGGTKESTRANIETTDWDGNKYLKGDVYVKCNDDSTGGKKLISFRFPNYSNNIKSVTSTETTWTATEDCYVYGDVISNGGTNFPLMINGTQVRYYDDSSGIFISTFTGYVRKGDIIQGKYWKAYSLYD